MTDPGQLRRRLEGLIGVAATEGNRLAVLRNGDEIFPAMLDAIRSAETTVDLLTYVYWKGAIAHEFAEALADAATRGVRVRVLVDAVGGYPMDRALVERMEGAGVVFDWFRKPWVRSPFTHNHRTHRKVLVVDGAIAFTGGVGIAEEWCGDARHPDEWRDTHVRLEGPAVDGLAAAFAQNWGETGRPLFDAEVDRFPEQPQRGDSTVMVVRGSPSVGWDDLQTLFRVVIESAVERIRLTTAYFAPSRDFIDLLAAAAARGVDVDVLLPGPHADKRVCQLASEDVYAELMHAGVRVWNYQPTMLHAKVLTIDDAVAVVGSSNFNRRSLDHDEEVVLVVLDPGPTAELDRHFEADLDRSRQLDLERWENRPRRQRLVEQATKPVRRWL